MGVPVLTPDAGSALLDGLSASFPGSSLTASTERESALILRDAAARIHAELSARLREA